MKAVNSLVILRGLCLQVIHRRSLNPPEMLFLSMLLLFTASRAKAPCDQIITVPPSDVEACWGGIAKFTCGTNRSDYATTKWQIDAYDTFDQEMRKISIEPVTTNEYIGSTLSIMGLSINNGAKVGCIIGIVIDSLPFIDTDVATFTVSDIPPVKNLNTEFNSVLSLINVSWSEPDLLPFNYEYVIGVDNGTGLFVYDNTKELQYQIPIYSCSNHTVSVVVKDIGMTKNQSSSNSTTLKPSGDLSVEIIKYQSFVSFQKRKGFYNITCKVIIKTESCQIRINETFVKLLPIKFSKTDLISIADFDSFNKSTGIALYHLGPFKERFKGEVFLSSEENPHEFAHSNFSMFNVQDVTITTIQQEQIVSVKCLFADHSVANGCNVSFNNTMRILKRQNDSAGGNFSLQEGVYNVYVYDVGEESVNSDPAYIFPSYTVFFSLEKILTTATKSFTAKSNIVIDSTLMPSFSVSTDFPSISVTSKTIVSVSIVAGISLIISVVVSSILGFLCKKHNRKNSQKLRQEGMVVSKPAAELSEYVAAPSIRQDEDQDEYFNYLAEWSEHPDSPPNTENLLSDSQESSLGSTHYQSSPSTVEEVISSESDKGSPLAGKKDRVEIPQTTSVTGVHCSIPSIPLYSNIGGSQVNIQTDQKPDKPQYADLNFNIKRPLVPPAHLPPQYTTVKANVEVDCSVGVDEAHQGVTGQTVVSSQEYEYLTATNIISASENGETVNPIVNSVKSVQQKQSIRDTFFTSNDGFELLSQDTNPKSFFETDTERRTNLPPPSKISHALPLIAEESQIESTTLCSLCEVVDSAHSQMVAPPFSSRSFDTCTIVAGSKVQITSKGNKSQNSDNTIAVGQEYDTLGQQSKNQEKFNYPTQTAVVYSYWVKTFLIQLPSISELKVSFIHFFKALFDGVKNEAKDYWIPF